MIKYNLNIIRRKITVGGKPIDLGFMQRMMPVKNPEITWRNKCDYVRSQTDIRSSICVGCATGKVYDKNNVLYVFHRVHTMDEIKLLLEKVRKINNE